MKVDSCNLQTLPAILSNVFLSDTTWLGVQSVLDTGITAGICCKLLARDSPAGWMTGYGSSNFELAIHSPPGSWVRAYTGYTFTFSLLFLNRGCTAWTFPFLWGVSPPKKTSTVSWTWPPNIKLWETSVEKPPRCINLTLTLLLPPSNLVHIPDIQT